MIVSGFVAEIAGMKAEKAQKRKNVRQFRFFKI
jgi:hypothetical protein